MVIGARSGPIGIRLAIGVQRSSISNGYNIFKIPIDRGTEAFIFLQRTINLQVRRALIQRKHCLLVLIWYE